MVVYASLEQALQNKRIPLVNWDLVRQITAAISIAEYRDGGSYIVAKRRGRGKDLHIAYGYTNGFETAEEAERASGLSPHPSIRGWYIAHPENRLRDGSSRNQQPAREHGTCPNCFRTRSATGRCDCDE